MAGEQVTFVGSTQVDAVFVRPGVSLDFTLSGASADKIYLSSSFASYTSSISGSTMTLQRGAGDTFESVSFIKATNSLTSDKLIFSDGTLSSYDLYNTLKSGASLPALSQTETSVSPGAPAAISSTLNATIKAFALNSAGDTFAMARPGVAMTVVGSAGVDTVYVPDGGVVDCTLLGGGQDLVYFRGAWGDYTKTLSGSVLTFSRSVGGVTESVKVVAGSSLSLNDQLTFADGTVHSYDAKTAIALNTSVVLSSVNGYDAATLTPGIAPTLKASGLNGMSNLDVTSNIVLNYSETVTAAEGKYVHIINDGGAGFHGENATHTLDILVTDTSQVSISGGKVTVNPLFDLDLANNYHVTIDGGAFAGAASQKSSAAFDGTSSLHFSTVTPGVSALSNAAVSQAMDASGVLIAGHSWLDLEGIGNPAGAAGSGVALDLSATNFALIAKDYDSSGANVLTGYDGVTVGDFYVAANNFGSGDLLYIDNQGVANNDLNLSSIIDNGHAPTTIQFSGNNGGLGGFVDVTLSGSTGSFSTLSDLQTQLGTSSSPITSDIVALVANHAPTGAVSITGGATQGQTLTASNNLADADGIGIISYQWQANGADISGATATTLALTEAQVGKVIAVVASYTDAGSTSEHVTSASTSAVANLNDLPTGGVSIIGTAMQGQVLTASNNLADVDGLGPISYKWQANGVDIANATGSSFTVTSAQVGATIDVVASYIDGHSTRESVTSANTSTVIADTTPLASVSVTNAGSYTGHAGQIDTFVIDASQTIRATISGFQTGDILSISNRTAVQGINFINTAFSDGNATLKAGNATIDLTGLASDLFNNETSFDSIYGAHAITYAVI